MANLAIFVERYTLRRSSEMAALSNFRNAAFRLGHTLDFLFRDEMDRIPRYDGLLIRALTDPLNASYVASRLADLHGLRVIDDPDSIMICCDKVNMYRRLLAAGVPIPETRFVDRDALTEDAAARLFEELGRPLILKAPNTSFSAYVEKVETPGDFLTVGRRFLRRADRIVAQRFVASSFDWRVTTLDGEVLFVCKYVMPRKAWKIASREGGRTIWCSVVAVDRAAVDARLLAVSVRAARAIGRGLYGIDVKECDGDFVVIEVNDNPNIDAGEEDRKTPEVYEKIVRYLARSRFE